MVIEMTAQHENCDIGSGNVGISREAAVVDVEVKGVKGLGTENHNGEEAVLVSRAGGKRGC